MQTQSPTPSQPTLRSPLWATVLPWLLGGTVLACFLWLALGSYLIRSFSDCHNWLVYAQNFWEEVRHSRWPYGFPLFLRGALALVGPYWVFLANLPVLLVLFAVVSWTGTLCVRGSIDAMSGPHRSRLAPIPLSWAFLSVWAIVLSADVRSFPRYLNPYRDPLSYVLLMASVALFVRTLAARVPSRRGWGVAFSGVLLGLACGVREPSILMVLPLASYGFFTWRAGRRGTALPIPFWGTVLPFAAGLAIGLLPFFVQTYVATHQILLPPQAAMESAVVPGSNPKWKVISQVGSDAWFHYVRYEPCLLLLAAAGIAAAAVRRNRLVLSLFLPAALAYALFYSIYWTFVVRYFYVCVLFLSLIAGYALQTFLSFLLRLPRRGRAAAWLLLAAATCLSAARLVRGRLDGPLHQVPQAKAMAAEFHAACADATAVYAGRNLCEWIDWFGPCPSSPLPCWGGPGYTISDTLRAELMPRLERGDILYAAFWNGSQSVEPDSVYLRRALDRIPATTIDTDRFNAYDYARGLVWLYRIAPWTSRSTSLAWPVPAPSSHGTAYWYMLDAGDWPDDAPGQPAGPATIAVDGTPLSGTIPHGGAWVGGVAPGEAGGPGPRTASATISASHPLPREMPVLTGSLDQPLDIDFRLYSPFDHYWRLTSGCMYRDAYWHPGPYIYAEAEAEIPVPCPSLAGTVLVWDFLAERKAPDLAIPVSVYEGDILLGSCELPCTRELVKLVTPLPWAPDLAARKLRMEIDHQPDPVHPDAMPIGCELYQVHVHRWPAAYPVDIHVGSPSDVINVLSGFHASEGRGESAYRWTSGHAEMAVYLPPTDAPAAVLRIAFNTESIPAEANFDASLRITWDGNPVEGHAERAGDAASWSWQATLPASSLDPRIPHRLAIDTPTWRPADYGSRDSRTLSIRLHRVTVETTGQASRDAVAGQADSGCASPS